MAERADVLERPAQGPFDERGLIGKRPERLRQALFEPESHAALGMRSFFHSVQHYAVQAQSPQPRRDGQLAQESI
jgi:hypothetical protein